MFLCCIELPKLFLTCKWRLPLLFFFLNHLTQRSKVRVWSCLTQGHLSRFLEGIEPFHPSCVISSWAQLRGGVHPPDCGSFSWPSASRWCSSPAGWELVSSASFQKHLRDSNWQPSNQPTGQLVWPPAHCCLFTAANVYRRNWWGRSSSERDFFFFVFLAVLLGFYSQGALSIPVMAASVPETAVPGGISKCLAEDEITST